MRTRKSNFDSYSREYESDNWTVRQKAIQKISRVRSGRAVNLLIQATSDSHSLVRIEALKGISRSKASTAIPRVREIARDEPDPNVRWQALKTLGAFKDPSSAPVFVQALKNEDWLIREEAVRGLLSIDNYAIKQVSIPYVLDALNDPVESVAVAALMNVKIKDKRIYAKSAEILKKASPHNYAIIIAALTTLNGYRLDSETRNIVIDYLTHQNESIRITAFHVLRDEKKGRAVY